MTLSKILSFDIASRTAIWQSSLYCIIDIDIGYCIVIDNLLAHKQFTNVAQQSYTLNDHQVKKFREQKKSKPQPTTSF